MRKKLKNKIKLLLGIKVKFIVSGYLDFYNLDTKTITHKNIFRQHDSIYLGHKMVLYDINGVEVDDGFEYVIYDYLTFDDKNPQIVYRKK